ncbi:MAG: MFS transporter [Hyphomicrobiaceae bacterium]
MSKQSTPAPTALDGPQAAAPCRADASPPVATGFPLWPLLATLSVQTLATAAAYSLPAVAPKVGADLGLNPAYIGLFISIVYGVGILSALLSPGPIRQKGAVLASQAVLLATLVMILVAGTGTVLGIACAAALMGLAYGATAPASTHLLVPLTPPHKMNVVLSLRQIGVPLGGVLAGLLMPPLALSLGWKAALLVQVVPVLALMLALEAVRRRWDHRVAPVAGVAPPGLAEPLRLLAGHPALQSLCFAAFVYSGLQLCFIVYMATHLTTTAGFDLIRAGQALAAYQISGVVARPIWGWLADRYQAARGLLALQGGIMCGAAMLAGEFNVLWPPALILLVCVVGGATASGFTGIAYGEYARLGGARRTEATGLGAACMFAGVMVLPAVSSLVITATGSYDLAYAAIGLLALLAGILLTVVR